MKGAPTMGRFALTRQQTDFFERNGYLIVEGALSPEQLREADETVRAIVAEQRELGGGADKLEWEPERTGGELIPRRLYNPASEFPAFRAISESDPVLDRVESLFGPHLQFHHSKLNFKPPRVGSVVEWHQDLGYFPHTNTDLVACLVYLDDATMENGCLQVVPRQHKGRLYDHTVEGRFAGRITEAGWRDGKPEPVACEAPAGSMIMMHALTPHSSLPNRSPRSRRTLVLEYRAADAYPILYHEQIVPTEQLSRQVRGRPSPVARFTLTSFPMPQLGEKYSSLFDLQARYRQGGEARS